MYSQSSHFGKVFKYITNLGIKRESKIPKVDPEKNFI